jgi:predicted transcriptional regulator
MSNQYQAKYAAERKAAEVVLRKGLATVNEVAQCLGLQRQTVAVWVKGCDVASPRHARVEAALRAAAPRSRK